MSGRAARLRRAAACLGLSISLCLWALPAGGAPGARSGHVCTHFVDSLARAGGNGTEARPWNTLAPRTAALRPGAVLCLRGDASAPGRVYPVEKLELTAAGSAEAPLTLRAYPGERVVLRNAGPGSLLVVKGDYWIVEGLALDNDQSGSRAVVIQAGVRNTVLRGSQIWNGQSDGVVVSRGATGTLIERNHIHDFVQPDHRLDAHCILVQLEADRTVIRQNTIHGCSGDGVQLLETGFTSSADFAEDVQIVDNVFYQGSLARAENALDIKAAVRLTVRGNWISGYHQNSAIALQKASEGVVFEGNQISDSWRGISLQSEAGGWPADVTVHNNLLFDIAEVGIWINGVIGGTFTQNTIVRAGRQAFEIAHRGLSDGKIRYNLVAWSGPSRVRDSARFRGVAVGPNAWFAADADGYLVAPGDPTGKGDPGFVNAAAHNYTLRAGSPVRLPGLTFGILAGPVLDEAAHPACRGG